MKWSPNRKQFQDNRVRKKLLIRQGGGTDLCGQLGRFKREGPQTQVRNESKDDTKILKRLPWKGKFVQYTNAT